MANNNNLGRKGGPQNTADQASQAAAAATSQKKDNLFSRLGNQQLSDQIQQRQATQAPESQILAELDQEAEQSASVEQETPDWATEKEDEAQIARRPETETETQQDAEPQKQPTNAVAATLLTDSAQPEKKVADQDMAGLTAKNSDAEAMLAGADDKQLEAVRRARQEATTTLSEEAVMLAMAEGRGLDEDKKAEMLLAGNKDVELESLEGESGELRALVVAEQLPSELAGFARDSATLASDNPLGERETLKNTMDQLLTVSQQLGNYSELTNPELSIQDKATKLVEIVAYELDIQTRESLSSHPFHALLEDMLFDPAGMMAINRSAGTRPDVRTMGSFAVVLWQLAHDAVETRLENLDDKQQINEKDFLADTYREMSRDMFTKAMSKPSSGG
jgi:hypothetical protein